MDIVKGKYYKYNHANGFVLKALADSTGDNFRGVVVSKGGFNYEVGHEDRLWSVSRFVEIDFKEEEIDESAKKGRLLGYALKTYPIGTKYFYYGTIYTVDKESSHIKGENYIHWQVYNHYSNTWATIIKEEKVMETQKLSREGLKEIHSVACSSWKNVLESYGSRNPLENYVELTQIEVDKMFAACTETQLPIVSKYLKQDDGSIDLNRCNKDSEGFTIQGDDFLKIRNFGEYKYKSFYLDSMYNWEIKNDSSGILCLIPTKKKK
jgi:hypothetical protein